MDGAWWAQLVPPALTHLPHTWVYTPLPLVCVGRWTVWCAWRTRIYWNQTKQSSMIVQRHPACGRMSRFPKMHFLWEATCQVQPKWSKEIWGRFVSSFYSSGISKADRHDTRLPTVWPWRCPLHERDEKTAKDIKCLKLPHLAMAQKKYSVQLEFLISNPPFYCFSGKMDAQVILFIAAVSRIDGGMLCKTRSTLEGNVPQCQCPAFLGLSQIKHGFTCLFPHFIS